MAENIAHLGILIYEKKCNAYYFWWFQLQVNILVLCPQYNTLGFRQGIRFKSYLVPPAYNNGIELWFCKYLVSRIPIVCEQHYKDYMCRCRAYKAQVLSSCLFFLLFRTFIRLYFAVVSVHTYLY